MTLDSMFSSSVKIVNVILKILYSDTWEAFVLYEMLVMLAVLVR